MIPCLSCKATIKDGQAIQATRVKVKHRDRELIALRYMGEEYHIGDFVYLLKPEQTLPRLLKIAKIVDIGATGGTIHVLKFVRDVDHPSGDHSVRTNGPALAPVCAHVLFPAAKTRCSVSSRRRGPRRLENRRCQTCWKMSRNSYR